MASQRDIAFDALREQWEGFGERDALWSNLTEPGRDHGRWDLDEFLATGRDEVERQLATLDRLGVEVARGRALDFGCGAGRLTQALAESFERVDGVDIAESMIQVARQANRQGERCRFHVNAAPDLALFEAGTFDLVLSLIVLQHMEPRYALAYVREFVRVLRPGGVALFQVPEAAVDAVDPLPASAWRAELSVDGDAPSRLRGGEAAELRVRVRNVSGQAWPAGAGVAVGDRWRRGDESFVKVNDGRAPLPDGLGAGEETVVTLAVTPPNAGGRLTLEVDAVQERVAWFRERGSQPLRLEVEVEGGGAPAPGAGSGGADDAFEPWLEMNFLTREEVTAYVEAAGGEVVAALPDESAGHAFESYVYVVRRAGAASARAAIARLRRALEAVPERDDLLPPVQTTRAGAAGRAELWLKRRLARATRWFTFAQVEHDRQVARALAEVEAALLVQDAQLKALRERVEGAREDADT